MIRDLMTAKQRLGDKTYTWLDIIIYTTIVFLLGAFSFLIISAILKSLEVI